MDSRHTEALEAAIGLPNALAAVAKLPGVVAVQLDGALQLESAAPAATALPQIAMRKLPDGRTVAAPAHQWRERNCCWIWMQGRCCRCANGCGGNFSVLCWRWAAPPRWAVGFCIVTNALTSASDCV
ncbi:hypothetical protein [Chromatium okenii]|uniref:hypothetical protein n=1 Tax=Chromatium okenii TaxID=61644 RepID=UPI001F5B7652|nr:hypothetical protein [Chromatium okenii]